MNNCTHLPLNTHSFQQHYHAGTCMYKLTVTQMLARLQLMQFVYFLASEADKTNFYNINMYVNNRRLCLKHNRNCIWFFHFI